MVKCPNCTKIQRVYVTGSHTHVLLLLRRSVGSIGRRQTHLFSLSNLARPAFRQQGLYVAGQPPSLRSSLGFISSLLGQAPPAARLIRLPFAPLPHAFPTASASTPSGGVGALGPETPPPSSSPAVNSWELKRSSI